MISVLLSAYNESSNSYFWKTIDLVKNLESQGMSIELVVGCTDGEDDTLARLKKYDVKLVEIKTSKRSERYNAALKLSSSKDGDWIILNHPRSLLQENAFLALPKLTGSVMWGAFTHQFDFPHPLLVFTSWWSNFVRGDLKKIFYLDHCIFIRRDLLDKVGGIPSLEIFEDTLLSQCLATNHLPVRLPWKSTTSAVRFTKNGIWRQAIKNQILKIQFFIKFNDQKMNASYEKGLDLNKKGGSAEI